MAESSSGHIGERRVSPNDALREVAQDLLTELSASVPDLSGAIVLLPNLHASSALARALSEAAGRALVLPRVFTLATWCAQQPGPAGAAPEAVREATLFDALRTRKWFDTSDLWPLTAELAALFDDLTRYGVRLPDSEQEFVAQLEAAYQARAGEPMQFEARLVHELWRASAQPDAGRMDAIALYHLRLARIARDASVPLYAAGLARLSPAEESFFREYAKRAPVTRYLIDPQSPDGGEAARLFAAAWPESTEGADGLRERARAFAAGSPHSPIAMHREAGVALFAASSLEQEAHAIETQVRRWLIEGRQRIAVVALDRLVARRARALLERAKVMVNDETGWIFSTTSAATVVMRWLDAVSGSFYYQDLLDLLKSPFIFAGWEDRREAVFRLERIVRSESVVAELDRYLEAARADGDGALAVALIEKLHHAARGFRRDRRRRLHEWMSLLFLALGALGIDRGLERDPAGLQLLEFLRHRSRELSESDAVFSFGEWRQWLNRQLEGAEFRDTGIASPVVFTHLALTRLREFDAVALVGCDAGHLPGASTDAVFFNQAVRMQLGLPGREQEIAQIRDDLIGLLSRSRATLITWQALRNGEANLPSPYLERLQVFHRLAWNSDLVDAQLAALLPSAQLPPPTFARVDVAPSKQPAPAIRGDLVPARISASGYNSLLACPYQFHARYALGLRETEEVREELEKRDYGQHVHRILKRFHEKHRVASEVARDLLAQDLDRISEQVFREAVEASYLSNAWRLRWKSLIPAYLDWQIERESQGWRFHAAELPRTLEIELPGGRKLLLEGRIDRVDVRTVNGASEHAVVDYKTRNAKSLKDALKEAGEDVQLPVYVELLAQPVGEASFLSLDKEGTGDVPLDADTLAQTARAIERLKEIFAALHEGVPVPAQGTDKVCEWCEMGGLCRRKYWA
jgi:ATP-dependent helicase/nuclease subunit B